MSDFFTNGMLIDSLSTSVVVIDHQLRIRYVNNAAELLFEFSRKQMLSNPITSFIAHNSLKSEQLLKAMEYQESFTEGELALTFSHGKHCIVDFMAKAFETDSNIHLLMEFVQIDQQRKLFKDSQHWAHQQAAKELIRGLAHEIKNPLGGIRGAAQLLEKELINDEHKEFTTLIMQQSDRLRNMVDKLLGPTTVPNFKKQSVHKAIEQIRSLITFEAGESIDIVRDYDPSIPETEIDSDMIQQAILNIARNAIQALNNQGKLTLRTRIQRQQLIQGRLQPLCIEITIMDDGPGIAPEIKSTLFYPMVTTKSDGTGLGLSIAQSLIEHHRGKIEVESWPGHTEFRILLPIDKQDTHL